MTGETILVVEDERDIQHMLLYNLRKHRYKAVGVVSSEEAKAYLQSSVPDLILLDIMLPGKDGLAFCAELKNDRQRSHIPIILVTAKGDEAEVVSGLDQGADDYVTKPFSPRVLLARVQAVLRRRMVGLPDERQPLLVGALSINPSKFEVKVADQPVKLTQTEFSVLHYLARRRGWVCTRAQIVRLLHQGFAEVSDRSVDVQVVGLRKKLGQAGDYIQTVRGVGYRLDLPQEREL